MNSIDHTGIHQLQSPAIRRKFTQQVLAAAIVMVLSVSSLAQQSSTAVAGGAWTHSP